MPIYKVEVTREFVEGAHVLVRAHDHSSAHDLVEELLPDQVTEVADWQDLYTDSGHTVDKVVEHDDQDAEPQFDATLPDEEEAEPAYTRCTNPSVVIVRNRQLCHSCWGLLIASDPNVVRSGAVGWGTCEGIPVPTEAVGA